MNALADILGSFAVSLTLAVMVLAAMCSWEAHR